MFFWLRPAVDPTAPDQEVHITHGRAHEARFVSFVTYSPASPGQKSGWRGCDNLAISQAQHEREAA